MMKHLTPFIFMLIPVMAAGAEPISFNRDIRPILSDRCTHCHGPDAGSFGESWKGGLRLDTEAGAKADLAKVLFSVKNKQRAAEGKPALSAPGKSKYAIVPGKPDHSLLIKRIFSDDPDEVMPPPESKLKLSKKEKELLKRWISEGAGWQEHWSFTKIVKPQLPAVKAKNRVRTEVDSFVLAKLEKKGIRPAPEADRTTWLRRVTFDLTGLPPTVEELQAFLSDTSARAYEKQVDRLLATDAYAERMAGLWLDSARFADSNGYQYDTFRTMWPWRDWVIKAFQGNMSYGEFVTKQLAGDLVPNATDVDRLATGFNRNHGYTIEGGVIDEEYRVQYVKDRVHTVATVFLGLTLECSSCHDHKYDPFPQQDYYQLYAFFNKLEEKGNYGNKVPHSVIKYSHKDPAAKKAINVNVMVMNDKVARKTHILTRGEYNKYGKEVTADTPGRLPPLGDRPRNRLGLAQWLTAPENPLFARVTVNRYWHQFFGYGLVKTVEDFGAQGETPSHPGLLDWLAKDFMENKWDLQPLFKKIVLSSTYRQSSRWRPELEDPENRLLARGPVFRMTAEQIRDQALAVSGLLNRKLFGPPVYPYQPPGLWRELTNRPNQITIYKPSKGGDLYRKSLYTFQRRAQPHPTMETFDATSRDVCVVKRSRTNTPLQALLLMHDPTFVEASRALAARVLTELPEASPAQLTARAWQHVLLRSPDQNEQQVLDKLYQQQVKLLAANPKLVAQQLAVGEFKPPATQDKSKLAALSSVCLTLLNLSETITRN